MSYTILMVEDDFALAMGTEYALQSEGYEVLHAGNLKQAEELYSETVDLILLDMLLPDGTGITLCKSLRERGATVPIIFLTAVSEEANIVQGLSVGADDYVTKPYRVKELLSRVSANIRRSEMMKRAGNKVYRFGSHVFEPDAFRLLKDGQIVDCTTSELKLLRELLQNQGNVISRRALMERVYDIDGEFFDDNTLSVYMKRLRARLGEDEDYITTVRGVGYRFKKD
ncbi:MAG: response regulator transcription factor [Eubacteriales bacterium]|nr:response regulator transcription factor [Lachnospiraceae bacterium]MDO5128049.1 response regulator transcription factor [Eubacteriales bacterium]